MVMPEIKVNDRVVLDALARLAKKASDLSPLMQRIEKEVFKPAAESSWSRSGLQSRSGALKNAITPFSGKMSAGVGLRAKGGRRDKGLVFAKAHTHTFGRKKWSSKRAVFKAGLRMGSKGKLKWSNKIMASRTWRQVKSPWGDIQARPFIPSVSDISGKNAKIMKLIEEYINADAS